MDSNNNISSIEWYWNMCQDIYDDELLTTYRNHRSYSLSHRKCLYEVGLHFFRDIIHVHWLLPMYMQCSNTYEDIPNLCETSFSTQPIDNRKPCSTVHDKRAYKVTYIHRTIITVCLNLHSFSLSMTKSECA